MAGTGRVQVLSKTPIGYNQYDVTISFDIAFDWGGWNSGAYYTIYCNGQSSSGNASFSISIIVFIMVVLGVLGIELRMLVS